MTDLAATLECVVCGRWWLTAIGGHTGGNGSGATLCPGCHVDCENCCGALTVEQIHDRKLKHSTTPPACSHSCAVALLSARRRAAA